MVASVLGIMIILGYYIMVLWHFHAGVLPVSLSAGPCAHCVTTNRYKVSLLCSPCSQQAEGAALSTCWHGLACCQRLSRRCASLCVLQLQRPHNTHTGTQQCFDAFGLVQPKTKGKDVPADLWEVHEGASLLKLQVLDGRLLAHHDNSEDWAVRATEDMLQLAIHLYQVPDMDFITHRWVVATHADAATLHQQHCWWTRLSSNSK